MSRLDFFDLHVDIKLLPSTTYKIPPPKTPLSPPPPPVTHRADGVILDALFAALSRHLGRVVARRTGQLLVLTLLQLAVDLAVVTHALGAGV